MTLAIGTALQYGNYVIDALGPDDSIGPVYEATYIPRGQLRWLRVLGSRHPGAIPPEAERLAFYSYLQSLEALTLASLPSSIQCFEEDGVCYQVLAQPEGSALSHLVSGDRPLPLPQSLTLVLKLADTLKAIEPLGWPGLCLEPDQIWWRSETNQISFIGFDLPPSPSPSIGMQTANLVEGMRRLLYFLLTGQRADQTLAPLEVDLRYRRPDLQVNLDRALQRPAPASQDGPAQSLAAWVGSLPRWKDLPPAPLPKSRGSGSSLPQVPTLNPAAAPSPPLPIPRAAVATAAAPRTQVRLPRPPVPPVIDLAAAPRTQVMLPRPPVLPAPEPAAAPWAQGRLPRPKLSWSLLLTAMVAGGGGLGLGLQARLHQGGHLPLAVSPLPGINPIQSFPPLPDWNGKDFSRGWSNSSRSVPQRPDYGSTPMAPALHPTLSNPKPLPAAATPRPPVLPSSPVPEPALPSPEPAAIDPPPPSPQPWPSLPRPMAGARPSPTPDPSAKPVAPNPAPAPLPPPSAPAPSSPSTSSTVNL